MGNPVQSLRDALSQFRSTRATSQATQPQSTAGVSPRRMQVLADWLDRASQQAMPPPQSPSLAGEPPSPLYTDLTPAEVDVILGGPLRGVKREADVTTVKDLRVPPSPPVRTLQAPSAFEMLQPRVRPEPPAAQTPVPPPRPEQGLGVIATDQFVALGRGLAQLGHQVMMVPELLEGIGRTVTEAPAPSMVPGGALTVATGYLAKLAGVTTKYVRDHARALGVRPDELAQSLLYAYSPAALQQLEALSKADGFLETTKAAIRNPLGTAVTTIESVPQLVGVAFVSRGLGMLPVAARAAIGEGVVTSLALLSQKAQTGQPITTQDAQVALLSGATTGAIGALGARLSGLLGLEDVDVFAAGVRNNPAVAETFTKAAVKVLATGGTEYLEEVAQSWQEQVASNLMEGRPWYEGVGREAAIGGIAGGLIGAGFGAGRAVSDRAWTRRQAELIANILETEAKAAEGSAPTEDIAELHRAAGEALDPDKVKPYSSLNELATQKEAEAEVPESVVAPTPPESLPAESVMPAEEVVPPAVETPSSPLTPDVTEPIVSPTAPPAAPEPIASLTPATSPLPDMTPEQLAAAERLRQRLQQQLQQKSTSSKSTKDPDSGTEPEAQSPPPPTPPSSPTGTAKKLSEMTPEERLAAIRKALEDRQRGTKPSSSMQAAPSTTPQDTLQTEGGPSDATQAGLQPEGDQRQHPGVERPRVPAEASRSDRIEDREADNEVQRQAIREIRMRVASSAPVMIEALRAARRPEGTTTLDDAERALSAMMTQVRQLRKRIESDKKWVKPRIDAKLRTNRMLSLFQTANHLFESAEYYFDRIRKVIDKLKRLEHVPTSQLLTPGQEEEDLVDLSFNIKSLMTWHENLKSELEILNSDYTDRGTPLFSKNISEALDALRRLPYTWMLPYDANRLLDWALNVEEEVKTALEQAASLFTLNENDLKHAQISVHWALRGGIPRGDDTPYDFSRAARELIRYYQLNPDRLFLTLLNKRAKELARQQPNFDVNTIYDIQDKFKRTITKKQTEHMSLSEELEFLTRLLDEWLPLTPTDATTPSDTQAPATTSSGSSAPPTRAAKKAPKAAAKKPAKPTTSPAKAKTGASPSPSEPGTGTFAAVETDPQRVKVIADVQARLARRAIRAFSSLREMVVTPPIGRILPVQEVIARWNEVMSQAKETVQKEYERAKHSKHQDRYRIHRATNNLEVVNRYFSRVVPWLERIQRAIERPEDMVEQGNEANQLLEYYVAILGIAEWYRDVTDRLVPSVLPELPWLVPFNPNIMRVWAENVERDALAELSPVFKLYIANADLPDLIKELKSWDIRHEVVGKGLDAVITYAKEGFYLQHPDVLVRTRLNAYKEELPTLYQDQLSPARIRELEEEFVQQWRQTAPASPTREALFDAVERFLAEKLPWPTKRALQEALLAKSRRFASIIEGIEEPETQFSYKITGDLTNADIVEKLLNIIRSEWFREWPFKARASLLDLINAIDARELTHLKTGMSFHEMELTIREALDRAEELLREDVTRWKKTPPGARKPRPAPTMASRQRKRPTLGPPTPTPAPDYEALERRFQQQLRTRLGHKFAESRGEHTPKRGAEEVDRHDIRVYPDLRSAKDITDLLNMVEGAWFREWTRASQGRALDALLSADIGAMGLTDDDARALLARILRAVVLHVAPAIHGKSLTGGPYLLPWTKERLARVFGARPESGERVIALLRSALGPVADVLVRVRLKSHRKAFDRVAGDTLTSGRVRVGLTSPETPYLSVAGSGNEGVVGLLVALHEALMYYSRQIADWPVVNAPSVAEAWQKAAATVGLPADGSARENDAIERLHSQFIKYVLRGRHADAQVAQALRALAEEIPNEVIQKVKEVELTPETAAWLDELLTLRGGHVEVAATDTEASGTPTEPSEPEEAMEGAPRTNKTVEDEEEAADEGEEAEGEPWPTPAPLALLMQGTTFRLKTIASELARSGWFQQALLRTEDGKARWVPVPGRVISRMPGPPYLTWVVYRHPEFGYAVIEEKTGFQLGGFESTPEQAVFKAAQSMPPQRELERQLEEIRKRGTPARLATPPGSTTLPAIPVPTPPGARPADAMPLSEDALTKLWKLGSREAKAIMALARLMFTPEHLSKILLSAERPMDEDGYPRIFESLESLRRRLKTTKLMPLSVVKAILTGERPAYLREFVAFMAEQREKVRRGQVTDRDVWKAYLLTLMSMRATQVTPELIERRMGWAVSPTGMTRTKQGDRVRPEDALAELLLRPEGQRALDALEAGRATKRDVAPIIKLRTAFGWDTVSQGLTNKAKAAVKEVTQAINAAKGDPDAIMKAVQRLPGIAEAKQGFVGALLGIGARPTVDSIEINVWLTGKGQPKESEVSPERWALLQATRSYDKFRRVVVREIEPQIRKLAEELLPDVDPEFAGHVLHSWLWDTVKETETPHTAMQRAMRWAERRKTRVRASMEFLDSGEALLRAIDAPDVRSAVHELFHVAHAWLLTREVPEAERHGVTDAMLDALEDHLGVPRGTSWADMSVEAKERLVDEFLAYLEQGGPKTSTLPTLVQRLFDTLATWLRKIAEALELAEVEVSDAARVVFDQLLTWRMGRTETEVAPPPATTTPMTSEQQAAAERLRSLLRKGTRLTETVPRVTNASGESAASLEAIRRQRSMAAKGQQFAVRRQGRIVPLIGPEAVDYRVRPGEAFGVLEADGTFRVLDEAPRRLYEEVPDVPISDELILAAVDFLLASKAAGVTDLAEMFQQFVQVAPEVAEQARTVFELAWQMETGESRTLADVSVRTTPTTAAAPKAPSATPDKEVQKADPRPSDPPPPPVPEASADGYIQQYLEQMHVTPEEWKEYGVSQAPAYFRGLAIREMLDHDESYVRWLLSQSYGRLRQDSAKKAWRYWAASAELGKRYPELQASLFQKAPTEAQTQTLKDVGIEVVNVVDSRSSPGDTMVILGGKIYEWREVLKSRFRATVRGGTATLPFRVWFGAFVDYVRGVRGTLEDPTRVRAAVFRIPRLTVLREEQDRTPDRSGLDRPVEALLSAETMALLRRGREQNVPEDVIEEQIEDAALAVQAYERQEPLFLLFNEPGTGKTFVLGALIRELKRRGAQNIVYVTMNQGLIAQVRDNLKDYGIDREVMFLTYATFRTTVPPDEPIDALIFDECHSVKNQESQQGETALRWMRKSKFTVFSSGTPMENPMQAQYFAPTGIFDKVPGGFLGWAVIYGAQPKKLDTQTMDMEGAFWQHTTTSATDAAAAREWLRRRGIMTSRRMKLPPNMVEARFVSVEADPHYSKVYHEITLAAQAVEQEGRLRGFGAAYVKQHLQKRLLEAAKIAYAIEEARGAVAENRRVVIFVETKAERVLDIPDILAKERAYQEAVNEALTLGDKPPTRAQMGAKPEGVAEVLGLYMERTGERTIEIPSSEDLIVQAFGPHAAVYTGSIGDTAAQRNLERWRNGEVKVLVATMAKGGTGLSLHDTEGTKPTTQINVVLPWTGSQVTQVTQRTARYGMKSVAKQEWVFATNIPFDRALAARVGLRMRDMGAMVYGEPMPGSARIADFNVEDIPFHQQTELELYTHDTGDPPVAEDRITTELGPLARHVEELADYDALYAEDMLEEDNVAEDQGAPEAPPRPPTMPPPPPFTHHQTRMPPSTRSEVPVSSLQQKPVTFEEETTRPVPEVETHRPITLGKAYWLLRELGAQLKVKRRMRGRTRGRFVGGDPKRGTPPVIELLASLAGEGEGWYQEAALQTLAHEIGHLVDYLPEGVLDRGNLLGRLRSLRRFLKHEVMSADGTLLQFARLWPQAKALSWRWRRFDPRTATPGQIRYRSSSKEVYADVVSALLVSPGLVHEVAPELFEAFFRNLENKPEVYDAYVSLQHDLSQSSDEQLAQRQNEIEQMMRRTDQLAHDGALRRAERLRWTVYSAWDALRLSFVDKHGWALRAVRRVQERGGRIHDDHNPWYALREMNYVSGKAQAFVRRVVKLVVNRLKAAGVTWDTFGTWLFYERIAYGDRWRLFNPRLVTPAEAKALLERLEQQLTPTQVATIKQSAKTIRNALRREIYKGYREGRYSDEHWRIAVENDFYAPFRTAEHILEPVSAAFIPQTGTASDIANTASMMIYMGIAVVVATEHQRVKRLVIDFLRRQFPGQVQDAPLVWNDQFKTREPKEPPAHSGLQLVRYYEQGQPRGVWVAEDIANSLNDRRFGAEMVSIITMAQNRYLKPLLTTYNVGFQLWNLRRDWRRLRKRMRWPVTRAAAYYGKAVPLALIRAFGGGTEGKAWRMRLLRAGAALGWWTLEDALKYFERMERVLLEAEEASIFAVPYATMHRSPWEVEDTLLDQVLVRAGLQDPKEARQMSPPLRVARRALLAMAHLADFFETLPKAAVLLSMLEEQLQQMPEKGPEATPLRLTHAQRHVIRAEVATPDLLAGGTRTVPLGALWVFVNPMIQALSTDLDVAFRRGKDSVTWWWWTIRMDVLPVVWMTMFMAAALGLIGPEEDEEETRGLWAAIRQYGRLFLKVPDYVLTNFLVIPLYENEAGEVVYLRLPTDETGRTIRAMVWKALQKGLLDKDASILDGLQTLGNWTFGQAPTLTPFVTVPYDVLSYLSGHNVLDRFRGRWLFTDDEMLRRRTGVHPDLVWKMAAYVASELGLTSLWNFTRWTAAGGAEEPMRWYQYVPGLENLTGRLVQRTNRGEVERLRGTLLDVRAAEAQRRHEERRLVQRVLQQRGTLTRMTPEDVADAYREAQALARELYPELPPPARQQAAHRIRHRLVLGRVRRQADAKTEALLYATTNAQKVEVLRAVRATVGREEFERWVGEMQRFRVLSQEAVAQYRAQQAQVH